MRTGSRFLLGKIQTYRLVVSVTRCLDSFSWLCVIKFIFMGAFYVCADHFSCVQLPCSPKVRGLPQWGHICRICFILVYICHCGRVPNGTVQRWCFGFSRKTRMCFQHTGQGIIVDTRRNARSAFEPVGRKFNHAFLFSIVSLLSEEVENSLNPLYWRHD